MIRAKHISFALLLCCYLISSIRQSSVSLTCIQILAVIPITGLYCFVSQLGHKGQHLLYKGIICAALINFGVMLSQIIPNLFNQVSDIRVPGLFNNPGPCGCLQATAFVCSFHISRRNITLPCVLLLSIALTGSRAAVIASIIGFITSHPLHFKRLIWIFGGPLIAIAIVMFIIRPESIIGRLLVWRISFTMISESPLLGIGACRFGRQYMLYQADYFASHGCSNYICYAQDIIYPFNEYINILVELGVVGLILLLALIITSYLSANRINRALLATFAVFAFFSYPSEVVILLLLGITIIALSYPKPSDKHIIIHKWISSFIILIGFGAISATNMDYLKLLQSKKISGEKNEICVARNNIKKNVNSWRAATHLSILLKKYPGEIEAADASLLLPTSDNMILLGDYYSGKGNYIKAECYYKTAASMIPYSFLPKQRLWQLYSSLEDNEKAKTIAESLYSNCLNEGTLGVKTYYEIQSFLKQ